MNSEITTSKADRIAELINKGIESIEDGCRMIREELPTNPNICDEVAERMKIPCTGEAIRMLAQRVGVKHIAYLEYSNRPGALMLRKLPLHEQRRWVNEPIPLLVLDDKPHPDSDKPMLVALSDLTKTQAKQVFANDHVRTISEQRAWLLDKAKSDPKREIGARVPHIIKGRELIVFHAYIFTKRELQKIIDQMP